MRDVLSGLPYACGSKRHELEACEFTGAHVLASAGSQRQPTSEHAQRRKPVRAGPPTGVLLHGRRACARTPLNWPRRESRAMTARPLGPCGRDAGAKRVDAQDRGKVSRGARSHHPGSAAVTRNFLPTRFVTRPPTCRWTCTACTLGDSAERETILARGLVFARQLPSDRLSRRPRRSAAVPLLRGNGDRGDCGAAAGPPSRACPRGECVKQRECACGACSRRGCAAATPGPPGARGKPPCTRPGARVASAVTCRAELQHLSTMDVRRSRATFVVAAGAGRRARDTPAQRQSHRQDLRRARAAHPPVSKQLL